MKRYFIFIIVFFFLFPVKEPAIAREAPEIIIKPKKKNTTNYERFKAMEDNINALIAEREKKMEETMAGLSSNKRPARISFPASAWYISQMPAKKEADGLNSFLKIQNTTNALGFYFESENEERKIASSQTPSHKKRLLFEESLENNFKGYAYHPNLLAFDINLENGLRQTRENFQPTLTGRLKNSYLNQYHALTSFLSKKPYAFSLNADKSREVENREFFERQVVNTDKYGGNFGYRNEFIPVGFSFSNSIKKIDRASRPSENYKDDQLSLTLANNSQHTGDTNFEFSEDKFSRSESGTQDQSGTFRDFNLSNRKFLSEDEKKQLYSSFQYYDITGTSKSTILNLNENLNITHSDNLSGSYAYGFSDKSAAGIKTKENRINASLRHQLYESLTSSFTPYYFNSKSSSFSQDTYGTTLNEEYTKKLGRIGRLTSGIGLTYSEEKRKSTDNIISIIDEPHTLITGTLTFLDKPRVDIQTVVITDTSGSITYSLNVDYLLSGSGERTQIQRIPAGAIADGQNILADYQAKTSPRLKFNTLENNFHLRFDFLNDLVGVFYNVTRERHPKIKGGEDFIAQSLVDTTKGFDLRYKNLTIEFSDQYYDSSLSPYKQMRLSESVYFNPTEKSTLTFDSSQCKVILLSTDDTQKFFDFMSRYSLGLNSYSRLSTQAGFRLQQGSGIDLDDITAGLGYELNYHKLLLSLKYDYIKQLYLNDRLINHFFSFKVKRSF